MRPKRVTGLLGSLGLGILFATCRGEPPVAVEEPRPTALALVSGNDQTGIAGEALPARLFVAVTDQRGEPMAQVRVVWQVTAGNGSLSATTVTTDGQGQASVTWTLGVTARAPQTVSAAIQGLTIAPVGFSASSVPGPPATIAASGGNNRVATVGTPVDTAPRVVVRDRNANAVAGATVTFAVTGGGGSLAGAAAVTDTAGLAAAALWTLGTARGGNTVAATVAALAPAPFAATGVSGAPASVAAVAADTQTVAAGSAVPIRPSLLVRDQFGNPVPRVGVTFAVDSGGGSITGPTTETDTNGVATVGSWTVGSAAGRNVLAATLPGVPGSPLRFAALGVAGAPTIVVKSPTDPQTATAGGSVPVAPAVRVTDALGNGVAGVSVTFSVTEGGGSLGTTAATTDSAGDASSGGWTLGTLRGTNTVTATPGTLSAVTFTAIGVAGAPTAVTISTGDGQSVTAGSAVPIPPAVLVSDANGNPVPGVATAFAVDSGGGTLTGGATQTDTNGVAQALGWTLGTTAGRNVASATLAVAGSPVKFVAIATAGAPASMVAQAGAGQSAAVGAAVAAAPAVLVRDANDNPVPGVVVTFTVTAGGGALAGGSPAAVATDAAGISSPGAWTLGTISGTNTVTATLTGLAPVGISATGLPGPPATAVASQGSEVTQSALVATAVPIAPAVLVRDQYGNNVPGVPVTFSVTGGGGSLGGASATTGATGLAAAASWTVGTAAGTNTVSAAVAALPAVTFTATGTPAAAAFLTVLEGDGQSAAVGTAVAIAPGVLVRDQYDNPVPGVGVTFAVQSGGGAITGASAITDAVGLASVGSWTLGPVAGINSLSAAVAGVTSVTFSATGEVGAPATVTASAGDNQAATAGTPLPTAPAVVVRDLNGNPIAGVAVSFAVTGGGSIAGANAVTDAAGIATAGTWTLGTTAGPYGLNATVGGLPPATFVATAQPGPPATVTDSLGDNQSAVVGSVVAVAPAVVVRDALGNPVPSVPVTFAVASGGGSVTGGAATTDAFGVARVGSWRLGLAAGPNTVTGTVASLASTPVTFTATAVAGAPASVTKDAGDAQSATSGSAVGTAPAVVVRDANSNPVPNVSVTFAVASGGGGITGGAATTDPDGIAAVGTWTLGSLVGPNTLTATVAGLAAVTFSATGTVGAPDSIAVVAGDGQAATVGTALTDPVSVQLLDANDNPVPGIEVSFAVSGGCGDGSLGDNLDTTNALGIATSGSWTLGSAGGTNTLTATATAAGVTGNPVSVTATGVAAASLTKNGGDAQSTPAGSQVTTAPSVLVRDGSNAPLEGIEVTFAVLSGGGSITGGTATTDALGIAAVGSWTLGVAAGPNSLRATGSGVPAVTFTATGDPGAPSSTLKVAGDNQTATIGTGVATVPAVRVLDALGNPVPGENVTFAVASGGGTINGGPSQIVATGSDGVATAGAWVLGASAGANTLDATPATLASVTFTATAVAASLLELVAGDAQSDTAGSAVTVDPVVRVRDTQGDPFPGALVEFTITAGGGSVQTASVLSDGDGLASAGTWTLGTTAGPNGLRAAVSGLAPLDFTATGLVGAPATLLVVGGQSQSGTVGAALPIPLTVEVRDANDNVVEGVTVGFAVASGGGNLTPPAPTDALGRAATSWTLGTGAGPQSVAASAGALPIVTFDADAFAGAATSVAIAAGDGQSATVGNAVAVAPLVLVADQYGNPVAGVQVTFAVEAGGGFVTGPVDTTGSDGLASVGSWTLGATAGANAVSATTPGLTGSPLSFAATGTAGAPALLEIVTGNGQTATVATAVAVAPSVRVRDANGNPVPGDTVAFTVSSGGGSVSGGVAVTDADGIAADGAWTLGTVAGTNTLTASRLGLAAVSFAATGTAAPPANIAILAGNNQLAIAGAAVDIPPAVIVRDAYGNPAGGVVVQFSVLAGGGSSTGNLKATDAQGRAAVDSWVLGPEGGFNSLYVNIPSLPGVSAVVIGANAASGGIHSCAVSGGTTYCWGYNTSGQLGDGTVLTRFNPVAVAGGVAFDTVAAGGTHSCGLTAAGEAWCWGNNFFGQLGDGTTTTSFTPVAVGGGLTFAHLSAGFHHTCGLTAAGDAYCWGSNAAGQVGDGATESRTSPTLVTGLTFNRIGAGWQHTCGLSGGQVYCWGFNVYGQIGIGDTLDRMTPTLVPLAGVLLHLAVGGGHTCARATTGALYCWGNNLFGQLGDGTGTRSLMPVLVTGGLSFEGIVAGFISTCGITSTNTAYCWGHNEFGEVGDGTFVNRSVPTAVAGGGAYVALTPGFYHTCARTTGNVYQCWGDNRFGQLGDGTSAARSTPGPVLFP